MLARLITRLFLPMSVFIGPVIFSEGEARGDSTVVMQAFTNGDFRWRDAAGNPYSAAYQAVYCYTQARVSITFSTNAAILSGTITATGLKPNFAYQLKLNGRPEVDPDGNERVGLSGRWWQQSWLGSAWDDGGNLNDKGTGSSPNPNDAIYSVRRDAIDGTSPSGRRYRFTGYRPFDYFVTDAEGTAAISFSVLSAYHVLWRTSQLNPSVGDGPVVTRSFNPGPSESPAYDTTHAAGTVSVFGEWERLPAGGVKLPAGSYSLDFYLTEESFHGVDGEGSGTWAHAMFAPVQFVIVDSASIPSLNVWGLLTLFALIVAWVTQRKLQSRTPQG